MASEWRILYPVVLAFSFIAVIIKVFRLKKEGFEGAAASPAATAAAPAPDPFEELRKAVEENKRRVAAEATTKEGFTIGNGAPFNPEEDIDPLALLEGVQKAISRISIVKEGMDGAESPALLEKKLGAARMIAEVFKVAERGGFKKAAVKEHFGNMEGFLNIEDIGKDVGNILLNALLGTARNVFGGEQSGTYNAAPYLTPTGLTATPADTVMSRREMEKNVTPIIVPIIPGPQDKLYEAYEQDQLEPPAAKKEVIRVAEEEIPDWGASINYFDGNLKEIPWDADNKAYLLKSVVWGSVSEAASKSIFLKNYHRNLLGKPTNLIENDETGEMLYYSPLLPVTASDSANDLLASQWIDKLAPIFGSMAADKAIFDQIEDTAGDIAEKLRSIVSVTETVDGKEAKRILSLDEFRNKFGFKSSRATKIDMPDGIQKTLKELGDNDTKLKTGRASSKGIMKKLQERIQRAMARRMARYVTAHTVKRGAALAFAGVMAGIGWAATIFTAGAALVLALFATALAAFIGFVFGILDMIVSLLEQLLTPLFDSIFESQGKCPDGTRTLENIIGDDLYYFLEMFVPLGSIFTILNNYVCFGNGGVGKLKKPVRAQPYFNDSTMSIYYHQWDPATIPRGTKTKKTFVHDPNRSDECIGKWCFENCPRGEPYHKFSPLCRLKIGGERNWSDLGFFTSLAASLVEWIPVGARGINTSSIRTEFDPGYQAPDITALTFPWCNYASTVMLDRMAQFYYDMAWQNAFVVDYEKNIIEVSRIEKIFGVVASSEFSCDMACDLVRYQFNPLTGEHFKRLPKEAKPPPEGDNTIMSYIRFYFIAGNAGPNGLFTITGCTFQDYTGTDAITGSYDAAKYGAEYVPSMPKVFNIDTKSNPDVKWSSVATNWKGILARSAIGVGTFALAAGAGMAAGGGTAAVGAQAAGQLASAEITDAIEPYIKNIESLPPDLSDSFIRGTPQDGYILLSETRDFVLDRGPIKELAPGVVPNINFCKDVIIPTTQCIDKDALRRTIQRYHSENPTRRVKEVSEIEARGKNGCYYKWRETSYDPDTNIEGNTTEENEVILRHEIANTTSCQYLPVEFTREFIKYPIRTFCENVTTASVFTPDVKYDRPAIIKYLTANPAELTKLPNLLELKPALLQENPVLYMLDQQFLTPSTNLTPDSVKRARAGTLFDMASVIEGIFGLPRSLDEVYNKRPDLQALYAKIKNPSALAQTELPLQIPQGHTTLPSKYGPVPVTMSGQGIKYITRKEVTALDGTKSQVPIYPRKPFKVPREFPRWTTLGGEACPGRRCEDLDQIQLLMNNFNAAHEDKKIVKVTRGWTPKPDRCDYEVFMQRSGGSSPPVVSKETVSMAVAPSAADKCLFTRVGDGSAALNSGTFIIDATPLLKDRVYNVAGKDLSGVEVSPYKTVTDSVKSFFTDTLAPLFKIDFKGEVVKPAQTVEKSLETTQKVVAQALPFKACPEKKCSDPDLLLAMMTAYNTAQAPAQISGGEGNTMKRILKAAVSGPDTCDVMFENLYELFDDVLQPPLESYVDTKVYRFKVAATTPSVAAAPCTAPFTVASGATSMRDISGSSLVINYDTAALAIPYSPPVERIFDCRQPAFLAQVKQKLEQKNNVGGSITVYKAITLSFQRGNTQCEYKMFKDMSYPDWRTGEQVVETEVETFVRVDVDFNAKTGTATIQKIEDFDSDNVDYVFNKTTADYDYYIGPVKVTMPFLFGYDETTASPRVNADVYLF
jgi:hypothetical protein